jgi:hypothetical protein
VNRQGDGRGIEGAETMGTRGRESDRGPDTPHELSDCHAYRGRSLKGRARYLIWEATVDARQSGSGRGASVAEIVASQQFQR